MPPSTRAPIRVVLAIVVALSGLGSPVLAAPQGPDWAREERERRTADYAACQQKDAAACGRLGHVYVEYDPRLWMPTDEARALHFYLKGCDAGGAHQCLYAARLQDAGAESPDAAAAARTYERGCDAGSASACARLADLVAEGQGLPRDDARATALYERGCGESKDACRSFGIRLQEGRGITADPTRAVAYLQRACAYPVETGCYRLGLAYQQGLGVARDETKARAFLATGCTQAHVGCRDACVSGDATSCVWGARIHDHGENGATHDSGLASELYERAIRLLLPRCESGDATACEALHRLRREAQPLTLTDTGLARRYLSWACAAGGRDGRACFDEARLIEASGTRDEALDAYDRACSRGSIEGCLRAAVLLPGEAAHYRARAADLRRYEER